MAKIDVLSSCLVHMATASTPISGVDLTPWDLQLLQLDPIQLGILFDNPNSNHDDHTFIHRLKDSFSRALDYFPPLAGRLVSTTNNDGTMSFFVSCNNAGVEFTHAVATNDDDAVLSVSDLVEPKFIPEIIHSLFPLNGVANCDGVVKPLLGVQVTRLADGFFIGCTANHAVVDGTSFWHFLNSWSELCRGLGTISKFPIFQRCFPGTCLNATEPIRLPPLERNEFDNALPLPPLLQRFLHYSKQSVANLKARANSEAGLTNKISSLQAVSAHLWKIVIRCRHKNKKAESNVAIQDAVFRMIVGARPRFPLPEAYFGNAVSSVSIICNEAEVLENSLGYVARKINELVSQQTREAGMKVLKDRMEKPEVLRVNHVSEFRVTNSPRYDVYGCDFGWGKPVTVRSGKAHKCDGKMSFFPALEAGGIDVEVCLAPETMKAMGDDAEFLEIFN